MIDRRTKLYKRQQKVLKQGIIILVITALLAITLGIVNAQESTIELLSPKGESLESAPALESNDSTLVLPSDAPEETRELTVEQKIMAMWGPNEGPRAWKIVSECENRGIDPYAINWNSNGTHDVGIFMINSVHGYSDEEMFDVDRNIAAAYEIYWNQGWTPWACAHVINETPFYLL